MVKTTGQNHLIRFEQLRHYQVLTEPLVAPKALSLYYLGIPLKEIIGWMVFLGFHFQLIPGLSNQQIKSLGSEPSQALAMLGTARSAADVITCPFPIGI